MDSPSSDNSESPPFVPFTKAERIQQLNDIDKSIVQLVKSAGLALQTLTASRSSEAPHDREAATASFEAVTNTFLTTLQKVDVGLRRQIYGLEEADILPAEKEKKTAAPMPGRLGPAGLGKKEETSIADGMMGKLDIGFLNTRSGRVGRDMEAELWEKARSFLENLEVARSNGTGQKTDNDGDEDMGT